jgi:hypothetical protein
MTTQFLKFEDKLWIIQRTIHESHNPIISSWREHLNSDKVLRKDGILYFLVEVTEVEYEEIKETTESLTEIIKEEQNEAIESLE